MLVLEPKVWVDQVDLVVNQDQVVAAVVLIGLETYAGPAV